MTQADVQNVLANCRRTLGMTLAVLDAAPVAAESGDAAQEAVAAEVEAVLRHLRRKGAEAVTLGLRTRQLLLAELVGEFERGDHRS